MPNNNKKTLYLIIVLLMIFTPLSIYSTIRHYHDINYVAPTCDIKLTDGSCYSCVNANGYCAYARNYLEDKTYKTNYYQIDSYSYVTVSGDYVFIVDTNMTTDGNTYEDNAGVILYNLKTKEKTNVMGIKNYTVGIDNNYYIIANLNNKYGIFTFTDTINPIIDYKYDFIGLINKQVDEKLDSSKFVVLENSNWKLIDINDNTLTANFSQPIYDYNDSHVILTLGGSYKIYSYASKPLSDELFNKVILKDKYIGVLDSSKYFYVFDCSTEQIISQKYKAEMYDNLVLDIVDGELYIYKNGEVLEKH